MNRVEKFGMRIFLGEIKDGGIKSCGSRFISDEYEGNPIFSQSHNFVMLQRAKSNHFDIFDCSDESFFTAKGNITSSDEKRFGPTLDAGYGPTLMFLRGSNVSDDTNIYFDESD